MSAVVLSAVAVEQPTKRDRSASAEAGPRAKLSNMAVGTEETDVRAFLGAVAPTSLLLKNGGRVAIVSLRDEEALQALLALNGRTLGERQVKVGIYFGPGAHHYPPAKKAAEAPATQADVDAAGAVTVTVEVVGRPVRFAVAARDAGVHSLAKDAIAALDLFDVTPGARVPLAATRADADLALKALREALTNGAGRVPTAGGGAVDAVGFDAETKPVFQKGAGPNDVALVQLAVRGLIVLVRLDLIGGMPDSLRQLLEDPSVLKVGVGCAGDEVTLQRRCPGLDVRGSFFDLERLAKAKFPNLRSCGLKSLVAILVGKRMSKGQQTKNWEQASYTPAMIRYAANDAAAGLLCLELLLDVRR